MVVQGNNECWADPGSFVMLSLSSRHTSQPQEIQPPPTSGWNEGLVLCVSLGLVAEEMECIWLDLDGGDGLDSESIFAKRVSGMSQHPTLVPGFQFHSTK